MASLDWVPPSAEASSVPDHNHSNGAPDIEFVLSESSEVRCHWPWSGGTISLLPALSGRRSGSVSPRQGVPLASASGRAVLDSEKKKDDDAPRQLAAELRFLPSRSKLGCFIGLVNANCYCGGHSDCLAGPL